MSLGMRGELPNALVQLQAHYHHCGEAASEKCLSAATFVRRWGASVPSFIARHAAHRDIGPGRGLQRGGAPN